jgi:hypothetical protein
VLRDGAIVEDTTTTDFNRAITALHAGEFSETDEAIDPAGARSVHSESGCA